MIPSIPAIWSVDFGGTVFPSVGDRVTFAAHKSPGRAVVSAEIDGLKCTHSFEIVAPCAMQIREVTNDGFKSCVFGARFSGARSKFTFVVQTMFHSIMSNFERMFLVKIFSGQTARGEVCHRKLLVGVSTILIFQVILLVQGWCRAIDCVQKKAHLPRISHFQLESPKSIRKRMTTGWFGLARRTILVNIGE